VMAQASRDEEIELGCARLSAQVESLTTRIDRIHSQASEASIHDRDVPEFTFSQDSPPTIELEGSHSEPPPCATDTDVYSFTCPTDILIFPEVDYRELVNKALHQYFEIVRAHTRFFKNTAICIHRVCLLTTLPMLPLLENTKVILFLKESLSWSICFPLDDRKGYHNHPMVLYPEGHRQFSGLSEKARQIVRDMTAAQARPALISAAIQEKYPSDNAIRQQVYNYRAKLRSESFEGRDVTSQLMHLASRANYIVFADSDKDKHTLTRVFMSHPQSALLFQTYYRYVGIDSTYKTN
ncbi:Unknown protein, partial [Striga hermonthica]